MSEWDQTEYPNENRKKSREMLISRFLEVDIEEGMILSIDSLVSRHGVTVVTVTTADDEQWNYPDQNTVLATGCAAFQGPAPESDHWIFD